MAHRIDLKNWRANQDYPASHRPSARGSTRYSRARLSSSRGEPEPHQYTWWFNRGQAWANNTGWRIDYQVVSSALGAAVRSAGIYKRRRYSDHAPLTIDYDWPLK